VDLNNDGYTDIVSGKYYPNDITWFKGSKKGFEKGIIIKEDKLNPDKKNQSYTDMMSQYQSTPCFIDIDGDKDLDLFVATASGVFFNRNIGTPENPKFGKRKKLITTKGNPIESTYPTIAIVDWDKDNILDIIITDGVARKGDVGLSYYKGLGNEKYETKVPIVKNEKGKRYIPGILYWICSTDWNNDGKPDFLVGTRLLYRNGKPEEDHNRTIITLKDFLAKNKNNKEEMTHFYKGTKSCASVYLLLGK
jgi:hypothetical protein